MPSVRPVAEQVAATAGMTSSVWASFSVCSWGTRTSPQTEHFLPSVRPVAEQVAATAGMTSSVWASFSVCSWGTSSAPQSAHSKPAVRPVEVQVASTAGITTVFACSQLPFSTGSLRILPQTEHFSPAVIVSVAGISTGVCSPVAGTAATTTVSPQTVQVLLISPASAQVGSFVTISASSSKVWGSFSDTA